MKNTKNVLNYLLARGGITQLEAILAPKRTNGNDAAVFLIDHFFQDKALIKKLPIQAHDSVIFINSTKEPTTDYINTIYASLKKGQAQLPVAVIGIGGGTSLDIAKAISNLFTNGGAAEDYQGWDLVKVPGVFKVGVVALAGTGAEASRTCVMTNPANGLKLGMNSDFTMFDQVIMDPDLTKTVPHDQYFYTGVDSYVHCIESLSGRFRHPVSDALSEQALQLCRSIFLSEQMQADANQEKLMVASYLGGCAIANSFVGVIHPFSAGLSVVLGIRHGLANCIAMQAMDAFYPREVDEFGQMLTRQNVTLARGVCDGLTNEQYEQLYKSTIIHEVPLKNALGDDFQQILTKDKVIRLFQQM